MRKLLAALAVASVAALSGSAGAGADSSGAGWLAAGTGTLVCCNQPMVHVNAQSNTGGGNVRGHFWIRYPNGGADFGGHIVCLDVVANDAGMIGRIDDVNVDNPALNFEPGYYVNIRVNDHGSPGTADTVNFDPGTPSQPASCPPNPFETLVISQGNYVVHDQAVTDPLQLNLLNQFLSQIEAAANDPYG
jgi:hypothetical protein